MREKVVNSMKYPSYMYIHNLHVHYYITIFTCKLYWWCNTRLHELYQIQIIIPQCWIWQQGWLLGSNTYPTSSLTGQTTLHKDLARLSKSRISFRVRLMLLNWTNEPWLRDGFSCGDILESKRPFWAGSWTGVDPSSHTIRSCTYEDPVQGRKVQEPNYWHSHTTDNWC